MKITEEVLRADLAMLNHGGPEAISLFLEMSRMLHDTGQTQAVLDWIVVAAPQLPEKERGELIALLMHGYLGLASPMTERDDRMLH